VLLLLSGATRTPRSDTIGDLVVPRAGNRPAALTLAPGRWAIDNGAFRGFHVAAFMRTLEQYRHVPGCLFVAAPDVVGDAKATLRLWPFWRDVLHGAGFPAAFVLQDGIAAAEVPADAEALFIGGTTRFKLSPLAASTSRVCQRPRHLDPLRPAERVYALSRHAPARRAIVRRNRV
jgi:hypothetical protein